MESRFILVIVLAQTLCCGCGSRRNTDLLESRLRQQEDHIAQLQREIAMAHDELETARLETGQVEAQLTGHATATLLPEQIESFASVRKLQFNGLLTGPLDRDGQPGDDILNVVLQPIDADGDLIKVPGELRLELFDLSLDADRQRIGEWDWPLDDAREIWHRGTLGSGFVMQVPLPTGIESTELLLHARLTTIDGRQFDCNHSIRVEPSSGFSPTPVPPAVESPATRNNDV